MQSDISQVLAMLPLLTDTVNKRVSRSESSCTSDQYETRSLEDKTLRVLSKPSRRRERNSAGSNDKLALRESTDKSCKERKSR